MEQNYYRLLTLLGDIGTKVLRKFLEHYSGYASLPDLLNGKKDQLYHSWYPKDNGNCCCNPRIKVNRSNITKAQFDSLFDRITTTPPCTKTGTHHCYFKPKTTITFDILDISLVRLLIVNIITPLSIADSAALEKIRDLRNDLAHNPGTSMSDFEFDLKWWIARRTLLHLANTLPQPFAAGIKDNIEGLKTKSLDPSECNRLLELVKSVKETDTLLEETKGDICEVIYQVKGLKGEVDGFKGEVSVVKDKIHEVTADVKEVKNDVQLVKDEVLVIESGVHETKGRVNDIKREVDLVKGDFQEVKCEVHEIKCEVHEVTAEVHEVKRELDGIKGNVHGVQVEVQQVTGKVDVVKNDVQKVQNEVHEIKCEVHEVKSEVHGVRGEANAFKSDVQVVKSEIHEIKDDVHEVKDNIQVVQCEIHEVKGEVTTLRKEMQQMESNVCSRTSPDEKCKKVIHREPRLEQIIENTVMMLQKHRKNIYLSHERAMKASYEGLCKDRHITITGRGGEGKTSLGKELMDKVCNEQTDDKQRYTPVILDKADDFDLINGKDHLVILIDDPFGKSNTDKQRLEEWERRFEKMSSFIKEGKIFIILCIRSYILKGIDEKLRGVEFLREEKSVNLSGKFQLDSNEKYDMLKAYEQAQSSDSTGANRINENILFNVSMSDPSLGFPQSCHLFFSSKHISDNILDFFNQPDRSLQKEIYNMKKCDPTQYMVLVFMLLEGGELDLDELDTDKLEKLCELTKMHSVDVGDITESVLYGNVYIEQADTGLQEKFYQFTHQTILESVLLSFCRTYPDVFLQLGEDDMILEFARPAGYKRVPGEVCVILPESCHRQLAKWIASLKRGHYVLVMRGYYTDKSFVKNFIDEIEKINFILKDSFVKVILSKIYTFEHNKDFLHFLAALCKRLVDYRIPSSEESFTVKQSLRKTKIPVYLFIEILNLILEAGEVAVVDELLDSSGLHLHLRFNLNGEIIDESVPLLTGYPYDAFYQFVSVEQKFSGKCCGNPVCYACFQRYKNLSLRLIDRMETVNLDNVTRRLMFILISRDWLDGLQRLINKNREVFCHIDLSNLMVHAVKRGSKKSVLYLLDFDMPLFYERNTLIQYCLRKDGVLNTLGMSQSDIIYEAVGYTSKNIGLHLLQCFNDITAFNQYGKNLLNYCCENDWVDVFDKVLEKDEKLLTKPGLSPSRLILHAAKHHGEKMVARLFRYNIDFTVTDEVGYTLLHHCCEWGWVGVFNKVVKQDEQMLYKPGLSPSMLILHAARSVHFKSLSASDKNAGKKMVSHMLHYDIDFTMRDKDGKTLLHYCCENAWMEIFDKVVEKDKEVLTKPGLTPSRLILHAAACPVNLKLFQPLSKINKGKQMVIRLLQYDIDFTMRDKDGKTLLHYCCEKDWIDVFDKVLEKDEEVLYKPGLSPSLLILHAACNNYKKMVLHLLQYDNDFTVRDKDGKTFLHYCCEKGWIAIFNKVLEKDEKVLTKPGLSPSLLILHAVACYSGEKMVLHLLQYDIDFTVSDKDGKTLLHYCCEKVWIAIFNKVLEKDEKVLTKPGLSPSLLILHAACYSCEKMVLHLLQYDNDFTVRDKDGKTLLHYCCEKDWIDIFDKVLEKDEIVLTKPGLSPSLLILHAAACPVNLKLFQPISKINKGKQMVIRLLQYDIDFTMRDKDGKTLLHCCCEKGWIDIFDKVLEKDEKVLTKPGVSPSLLILHAACNNCMKMVLHLLQYDIDFTVSEKDGKTLLHYCCEKDWINIFDKVLEKDEKVLTKPGVSPSLLILHAASSANRQSPISPFVDCYGTRMVSHLLQYDIDFTVSDKDGKTLLHYCCEKEWINIFDKVLEKDEKVLTKPGVSPSLLILHAACNNYKEMVLHLLQYDNDFTVRDKDGKTLLHCCCEKGWIDIFDKVLEKDEKVLTKPGLSPSLLILHAACNNCKKMVLHLLQYDIDFTVSDKDGKTLLHYCCEKDWINIFDKVLEKDEKVLTKPGVSPSLLILHAACNNYKEMVLHLLQYDNDFTVRDKDGKTLLHCCCEKGWIDIFDKVLEKDEKVLTKPGLSPSLLILHAAACPVNLDLLQPISKIHKGKQMVIRLLQYDIDFTMRDKDGKTLLHYCFENDWIDIFDKVLEKDEEVLTKPGLSPSLLILHAASSANWKSFPSLFADCYGERMVLHLLQYDIDFTVSDKDGKTLLHYCCENNWNDIVIRVLERIEK